MGGKLPEPVTESEYVAILGALDSWQWSHGPAPASVKSETRMLMDALWLTGCHPSVLTRRGSKSPSVRVEGEFLVWRRPKNERALKARLPAELAGRLEAYLSGPRLAYKTFYDRLRVLSKLAGLPRPVYPMRFRHRVGMRVTRLKGPGVAKAALGISDRVLKDYTSLSDDRAVAEAFDAVTRGDED